MFWPKMGIMLIGLIAMAAVGGLAFQAGMAMGAGQAVGAAAPGIVAPGIGGPGYYGWHPLFFFPFGFIGIFFLFFLFFGLMRAIFWGGMHRGGYGPGRFGRGWEDRMREMHDDWHRRSGEERGSEERPGSS